MALSPYQMLLSGVQTKPMTTGVGPISGAPSVPVMGNGTPEDAMTRARRMLAEAVRSAPQGIDPRMAEILNRRLQRISEQEGQIEKEQRRAPWEALMRAGAAMAASRSPFFGQGLAAGVSEGLGALQAARAEAMRRRNMAGEARDEIEMERIKQEGAGARKAREQFSEEVRLANALSEQQLREAQARKAAAEAIPDPQMRALELRKAEAQIREIESKILENRAQAARAAREGGGDGITPNQRYNAEQDFLKADKEMQEALAAYRANFDSARGGEPGGSKRIDPEIYAKYKAALVNRERARQLFERQFGRAPAGARPMVIPNQGVAPVAPASTKGWSIKPI